MASAKQFTPHWCAVLCMMSIVYYVFYTPPPIVLLCNWLQGGGLRYMCSHPNQTSSFCFCVRVFCTLWLQTTYVGFRVLYYIGYCASVFLCFVLFCDLCVLAFVLYCVMCVLVICIVSCIVIAGAHTQIRPCLCAWHMITGVGVHTCLWPTTARLLCFTITLNISSLYCDQLEYIEHIL